MIMTKTQIKNEIKEAILDKIFQARNYECLDISNEDLEQAQDLLEVELRRIEKFLGYSNFMQDAEVVNE
jgi:hypothetical protein